ncbi:hypothetical protein RF55_15274 [Lasius niger]|uniref:Uncharacterized protein n=1 Tax=Lasius niger TaxID=67767 RepID=A0A0J7K6B6_LASNI|nr:hypothetical protein RF55_15274 [Lasius niger]
MVRMEVGESVESDHHPLVIWIRRKGKGLRKLGVRREKRGREKWTQRGGERIREVEDWNGGEDKEIDEELGRRIKQITEELKKGEKESTEGKRRGWWDQECEEKRKKVWRKVLRKWRKEEGIGEGYRRLKGEYKLLCKRKKEEENERLLREAQEARTEGDV